MELFQLQCICSASGTRSLPMSNALIRAMKSQWQRTTSHCSNRTRRAISPPQRQKSRTESERFSLRILGIISAIELKVTAKYHITVRFFSSGSAGARRLKCLSKIILTFRSDCSPYNRTAGHSRRALTLTNFVCTAPIRSHSIRSE